MIFVPWCQHTRTISPWIDASRVFVRWCLENSLGGTVGSKKKQNRLWLGRPQVKCLRHCFTSCFNARRLIALEGGHAAPHEMLEMPVIG